MNVRKFLDWGKLLIYSYRWMRDDTYMCLIFAVERKQIVVSDGKDWIPFSPFITTLAHTMADAICTGGNGLTRFPPERDMV